MKLKVLFFMALLLSFAGLSAQNVAPIPSVTETVQAIADDGDVVEDLILIAVADREAQLAADRVLDAVDPGPLASNYQVPGDESGTVTDDTEDTDPEPPTTGGDDEPFDFFDWLKGFLAGLIPETIIGYVGAFMLVGETITRLTPTTQDDKWFLWFKRLVDSLIPSKKKEGGSFPKAEDPLL